MSSNRRLAGEQAGGQADDYNGTRRRQPGDTDMGHLVGRGNLHLAQALNDNDSGYGDPVRRWSCRCWRQDCWWWRRETEAPLADEFVG